MKRFILIALISINSWANFNPGDIIDAGELNNKFNGIQSKLNSLGVSINFLQFSNANKIKSELFNNNIQLIKDISPDFDIPLVHTNHQIEASNINNIFSSIDSNIMKLVGSSCYDLLQKRPSLVNQDGLYKIDTDGFNTGNPPFDVYCDMTTDGGGWTLIIRVTNEPTVAPSVMLTTSTSRFHNCLLNSDVSCPNNQIYWQSPLIKGGSYMKKYKASNHLVAKLTQDILWTGMIDMRATDSRFDYSYFTNNPSIRFNGYGSDSSSQSGCQDTASGINLYYFAISNGNSPCVGETSLLYPMAGYGFLAPSGMTPVQIYIR